MVQREIEVFDTVCIFFECMLIYVFVNFLLPHFFVPYLRATILWFITQNVQIKIYSVYLLNNVLVRESLFWKKCQTLVISMTTIILFWTPFLGSVFVVTSEHRLTSFWMFWNRYRYPLLLLMCHQVCLDFYPLCVW